MKKALAVLGIAILGILGLTGCNSVISYRNAAELLGLESGKAYPLVLGDKINGTVGSVTMHQGFFTSTTTVNLSPGSAVTVIFKKDNKEWHLEIPTNRTTFVISDTGPQTVELSLNYEPYYGGGDQGGYCYPDFSAAECKASLTESGKSAGLGPVIQNGLISATFTVSQATADQLSGRK